MTPPKKQRGQLAKMAKLKPKGIRKLAIDLIFLLDAESPHVVYYISAILGKAVY